MKITKQDLVELIKEELDAILDEGEPSKSDQAKADRAALERSRNTKQRKEDERKHRAQKKLRAKGEEVPEDERYFPPDTDED
jgi:hypothetical protein